MRVRVTSPSVLDLAGRPITMCAFTIAHAHSSWGALCILFLFRFSAFLPPFIVARRCDLLSVTTLDNLMHNEMKSYSSEAADLERSSPPPQLFLVLLANKIRLL